ncbi:restriction endonuclease subunit S [Candidatus Peregrinibacteria bacterium]|nr:restriction endonuclease subunit S [Candidatus Peregrinibacteria bacterium]
MATFRKVKIRNIAKINPHSIGRNFNHETIEYVDISSVGTGNFIEIQEMSIQNAPSRAKRLVKSGDTILSTVRPNRRSFFYFKNPKENTVVSTGFAVLRAIANNDPRYLYYSVIDQSFTDYLTKNAKGSAYPAIDSNIIYDGDIFIPEKIEDQSRIASILSAYDDLIENNEKRIRALEEIAQLLYTEWFVKFKFPGHGKIKMVDSGTDYGMIPEVWEVKRLGEIADLIMGQSPTSNHYNLNREGLPFHQGVADFGSKYPIDRVYSTAGNKYARKDDLLFSVRAPVGRMNIATKEIILGRGLSAIRHKNRKQSFLFLMFNQKFTAKDMIGNGAIYKSVNKAELENLKFVVPTKEIAEDFEAIVSLYFHDMERLTMENMILSNMRDLLIPQLVTGKRILK